MKIETREIAQGVTELTLVSTGGQVVRLLARGASLTSWKTPRGIDIVAAYRDPEAYARGGMYLGTTVGPNAGRIENGTFKLAGKTYRIAENGPHFLHSGTDALSFRVFDWQILKNADDEVVVLFTHRFSHAVLPGTTDYRVTYAVKPGSITITTEATSDVETLCNPTNHSYFNLDGDFGNDLSAHSLAVRAGRVVLIDEGFIGREIAAVAGTPFDFRTLREVMPPVLAIKATGQAARGLDHYFLLDPGTGPAARLVSARTGITLDVTTTCPGITVYSGNYPDETPLRSGGTLKQHGAICLETQYQANAVNDSRFAKGIVAPGRPYRHETTFTLGGTGR